MDLELHPFNDDHFMESEFIKLRDLYDIEHIIETGTFHAHTTVWMALNFNDVYTTEVKQEYYDISQTRLKEHGVHDLVTAYLSDSLTILPEILASLKKSKKESMFFLDAHWYTNPLLGELTAIAVSGYQPKVICIHDMKNPNDLTMGYDSYKDQGIVYSYEWVAPYIEKIYGHDGYSFYFNKEATGARRGALFIIRK